jgi:NADPH:quinone reductase-like Zn-dependent oxidoreductase
MKRIFLADSVLRTEEVSHPQPGPTEVLIRICAAGVTPTELLWYPTSHGKDGGVRAHAVPGHEFSGLVAGVGAQVRDFQTGQEVYGMNDWFADGATAEYCLTQPSSIAPKPRTLSHVEAASVPIGALTAWQGLIERAGLKAGERVLVHGGAGAVGIYAIQLARYCEAHVTATASSRNLAFVSDLGAQKVIDYQAERFEDIAGRMDVVFDTVGGETFERSWNVLKPGGRMITIAADAEASNDERLKQAFFIVEPNQQQLIEIGGLLDEGRLRPVVAQAVPLSEAPSAYRGENGHRANRGKVVVDIWNGAA